MDKNKDLRAEHRLLYHWPIWFADESRGVFMQGQVDDICSEAVAFTFYPGEISLFPSQPITAHFSVPICGLGGSFAVRNFTREGFACRIDQINKVLHRAIAQFSEPLPFRPGEQTCDEADMMALLQILSSQKGS